MIWGITKTFSYSIGEVELTPAPLFVVYGIAVLIILPIILFRQWFFYRRRLKKNLITAEYEPPRGFTPAEFGYLFDGKFSEREIGATLIHQIQKGVLHLKKEKGKKVVYVGPKVESKLKSYEALLLKQIENKEGIEAKLLIDKSKHLEFAKSIKLSKSRAMSINRLVHRELETRGYVKDSYVNSFWASALKMSLVLQIVLIWFPAISLWLYDLYINGAGNLSDVAPVIVTAFVITILTFPVFFILGTTLLVYRGKIVGREWIITSKLNHVWPQIVSYRNYVKLLENDRLSFDNDDLKKVSSDDVLPYAIALGFVKNWRKLID